MKKLKVYHQKLSHWIDPEAIFVTLFGQKDTVFWLDSSRAEEDLSRFSYMGEASEVISYSLTDRLDIFSFLQMELDRLFTRSELPFDFVGGFVGYFGYELKALTGSKNKYKSPYPDSLWFFVDRFLVFDYKEKEVYMVCLSSEKIKAEAWFGKVEEELRIMNYELRGNPLTPLRFVQEKISFHLARSHEQYLKDIAACKEYLQKGESYQICLTNTISTKVEVDSVALYLQLRKENPAPYAAFLKHKDVAVLCSSPERFLKIDKERWIESKPIKGTRKRSQNVQEDTHLAQELATSEKDRAENLMITDLLRNDLGKVSEIGSVSVPKFLAIETYKTVHQLVSTVRGKLRKDITVLEAMKACFPGGSMTGAPKLRTMAILERMEKKARGVYSGALGFLSVNGCVDLNIVIRTIVQKGNNVSIGAGGAVLIQSDAEGEYQEMMLKAHVLLETITKAAGAKRYSMIND